MKVVGSYRLKASLATQVLIATGATLVATVAILILILGEPQQQLTIISVAIGLFQIAAAVLAIVLVVIFGRFGVKQLEVARSALDDDRTARENERNARDRRILEALSMELSDNRLAVLHRAGRVIIKPPLPKDTTFPFKRVVYHGLLAGSGWDLSNADVIWPQVIQAYWRIEVFEAALHSEPVVLAMLGGVLTTAIRKDRFGTPRELIKDVLPGLARFVIVTVAQVYRVRCSGVDTQALAAVESALESVNREIAILKRVPTPPGCIDWRQVDAGMPPEIQVTPPRPLTCVELAICKAISRLQH